MALSVNLDQWADGPAPDGDGTGKNNEAWVNGNLNSSKAHYNEGDSIPYRMKVDDLTPGVTYTVIIQWDTVDSGAYAIDYLTGYNFSFDGTKHLGEPDVTPTDGINDLSSDLVSTIAIQSDPQLLTGFGDAFGETDGLSSGQPSGTQSFTIFGAVSNLSTGPINYNPTHTKASTTVTFTYTGIAANNADSVVIAWGGHIASSSDWSDDPGETVQTASDINGSPYHTRVLAISEGGVIKSIGNQDRSLSADAVLPSNPELNVDKTVASITDEGGGPGGTTADEAGDVINYAITVANTGDVTLTGVVVTDPFADVGSIERDAVDVVGDEDNLLEVGEIWGYTAAHTVTQAEIDSNGGGDGLLENTATADSNETGPDTDDASVPIDQSPAIDLVKTNGGVVDEDGNGDDAGDTIVYDYSVENTGNVTLFNVALSDDQLGTITLTSGLTDEDLDGDADDLAVGATATGEATATLTQAQIDAGSVTNIADVTGDDPNGDPVTDSDTNTVSIDQDPAIDLVKTNGGVVDEDGNGNDAGDTIVYDYSVENTGNVTLFNVALSDDQLGTITLTSGLTDEDLDGDADDLAVGATATGEATATLTQAQIDAGSVTNIADVTGDDPNGDPVTDSDTNTVSIDQNPAIDLVKTNGGVVDEDGNGNDAGDTIVYDYSVENTGIVTLFNVTLSDDQLGTITLTSGLTDEDLDGDADDLAVGATATGEATATLTQAQIDAGSVTNIADVTGDDPNGDPVTDSDTNTVSIDQDPAIDLVKTNGGVVDEDGNGNDAGDTIVYDYSVENTGNVTLFNVALSDDQLGTITLTSGLTDEDLDGDADDLAVGATATGEATATLTQAQIDAGSVTNIADVTGDDPNGDPVTDSDTNTVSIDQNPAIDLVKTNGGVVDEDGNGDDAGDTIVYDYSVENTGNVTLFNVALSDDQLGTITLTSGLTDEDLDGDADDLAVGATATGEATATLTQAQIDAGSVTNIADVTGDDPNGDPVTDSDANTVSIDQDPAIDLVKTNGGVVDEDGNGDDAGDTIVYDYSVENTGNVTLFNVALSDDQLGAITLTSGLTDEDLDGDADDLAVGATATGEATATLTQAQIDAGSVTNIADVTGDDPNGDPVTDSDTNTVSIDQNPALNIVKDADKTFVVSTSDVITYTYTVTNTGNVSLTNVVVTDDNFTPDDGDDFNPTFTGGDDDLDGKLGVDETWTYTSTHQVTQAELTAGLDLVNVATADSEETGPDTDDATVDVIEPPITVTGNPQFNFPNDVDKIQPKLQGGSFTLNSNAYIYWDLFTSNTDLAQINLNPATYSSDYNDLTVSIVKIWEDTGLKDAIYRVYVANENDELDVSLANNTNIVDYDVITVNGTPVLSTNKGLIDLINSDPLIGNFNNFNNIENALTKDATNGILTNPPPPPLTNASEKVWSSPDESGTAINEPPKDVDTLGGNDALYGRSNTGTETLTGGAGNDMIDGRAGGDVINGGDDNDYLHGGLGNDTINGGAGNDTLIGSYGINELTGGTGQDIFVVRQGTFTTIKDFDPTADQIWVWVDTLNTTDALTGSTTLADVEYDETTGFLSVHDKVIAFLENSPDDLTKDDTLLGISNPDIYVT